MHFTDEQPFLDAIFERYDDDRPRLVYADFLDDSDEPERAELIRVQLALARLNEDDPRRPLLNDRQAELLTQNRAAWTANLSGLVVGVDYRRGIPDSASVDTATFLERGEELFAQLPVRRLRLLDAAPVGAKLFASPLLARVRELDLCNADLRDSGLALLARSPFLQKLEALDLGFNAIEDAGMDALARSSLLPNLSTLALNDNDSISGDGVRALAESPFFAGLTALDLSGNDIGETGIAALVGGQSMTRIRSLRLNNNRIGDTGVVTLAKSMLLTRVLKVEHRLEVRGNFVGPTGAAALAACPSLANCTALDLTHNDLKDDGTAALLRSPYLGRLKVLRLARNQLTDAGIVAARDLFQSLLDRVQLLDLCGNRLTRVGLGVLHSLRGERPVCLEVADNVQSSTFGDAPVAVSKLVPTVLESVAEAARLRQRITHPRQPPEGE